MKRRIFAALAAFVLAGVGAVLLLTYVSSANDRAMAGMKTVSVLVVDKPVPEGATAQQLAGLVIIKKLPAVAVVKDAVADLKQVNGLVTVTNLQPGEQLLRSRFVDPASLLEPGTVRVPAGMQEVSLSLPAKQAVAGQLAPGAVVGLYVTPKVAEGQTPTPDLVLDKLLISRVQGGVPTAPPAEGEEPAAQVAELIITFAVDPQDVPVVISAAQNDAPWLSLHPAKGPKTGNQGVPLESVSK